MNEYNEYINDKVQEILFDAGAVDKIDEIIPTSFLERKYVYGKKNNQKVSFLVYLNNEGEWTFEYRENN